MSAVSAALDVARRVGSAIANAPKHAYRWFLDHASRAIAIGWIGGMTAMVGVTVKRTIKVKRADAMLEAAADKTKNGDGAPEVVEMLDVDEMQKMQDDRMHANGLAAAGESDDPDQKTMEAARAARATSRAAEGEMAGSAGGVIVVSKGGLAGWLKRNKGKKADPDTLAWLRGEEAAERREAYASWADHDDGDLSSWVKHNRKKKWTAAQQAEQQAAIDEAGGSGAKHAPDDDDTGDGAPNADAIAETLGAAGGARVAAGGSAAEPANHTVISDGTARSGNGSGNGNGSGGASVVAAAVKPPAAQRLPAFDLRALGAAATTAITPTVAADQRHAALDAMRAQLAKAPATAKITSLIRDRHIVLALPDSMLFGDDATNTELTADGNAAVRALAALILSSHHADLELRADPDRALEVASVLAVAGIDADRMSVAGAPPSGTAVEITLSEVP